MTDDFFRSRLDQMIELRHPLAVLAQRLPWQKIEARLAPLFAHQVRPLQHIEEALDLLGAVVSVSGGKVSHAGRPRLSMRWGCGGILGLLGGSSCFHTEIAFEPSSSTSS